MEYRLVVIEWVDSAQPSAAWQFLEDLDAPQPILCKSIGWLVYDGDEVKALAQSIGDIAKESVQVAGVMKIPSCSIRRIRDLIGKPYGDPFDLTFTETGPKMPNGFAGVRRSRDPKCTDASSPDT